MARAKLRLLKATGKRAAVYLRKSTDQQEASIPGQRQAVYEYATRHGYEIVSEFVDSGISGVDSSADRKEFLRLIACAERGEFDFVIAWDLSRITRSDPMETMAELRPLKRANVRIVTTDKAEPLDWDSFAGVLMLSIEAESNSQYVKKLARGTTRGQADMAKRGQWVAGRPPLGYVVGENRKLALGPKVDVNAVRWAYQAYADGLSLRAVQEGLRSRGIDIVVSSVKWMLSNRLYTGDFVWGRSTQGRFYSVRDGEVSSVFEQGRTEEKDQVIVPDNHPAIIDRSLFDRVQAMFQGRRRASTPHRSGGSFVLTGLLRCADCGYGMIGATNTSAKARNVFYRCGGSQTKGVEFCNPHTVQQGDLLQSVFEALKDRYANPETIKRLRAEVKRQIGESASKVDVKSLEIQLAKEKAKLAKASQRLVEVDNDLLDVVQTQVRSLKKSIDGIEQELRTATVTIGEVMLDIDARAERAIELFDRFEKIYTDADPSQLRAFLLETIDRVNVRVTRSHETGRWRYSYEGGEIVMKHNADLFDSW